MSEQKQVAGSCFESAWKVHGIETDRRVVLFIPLASSTTASAASVREQNAK